MSDEQLRAKVDEIVRRSLQSAPLSASDIDLLICYIDILEYRLFRTERHVAQTTDAAQLAAWRESQRRTVGG